jgi:hypothetical protein
MRRGESNNDMIMILRVKISNSNNKPEFLSQVISREGEYIKCGAKIYLLQKVKVCKQSEVVKFL